jgi:hypothetical protein
MAGLGSVAAPRAGGPSCVTAVHSCRMKTETVASGELIGSAWRSVPGSVGRRGGMAGMHHLVSQEER